MTLALNTSHALYGNLKMLLGVNEAGDTLVDLVTPSRTFTKHANAVYGTGGLGRHAGIRKIDGATPCGWTFDTPFQPVNNTGTLVVVFNKVTDAAYGNAAEIIGNNDSTPTTRVLPRILYGPTGGMRGVAYDGGGGDVQYGPETATQFISVTPKMVTLTRNGTTGNAIYVNGTSEGTGGQMGTNSTAGVYSFIGGMSGYASMDADVVWIAWFDKVLTPTEVSDLYATLGASNAFGLLAGAPAATATTLSGPSSGTVGVASSNFTVGADGAITGTVVITPSDGGAGGTFTPTTVSVSSGTPTGTFTYTPASTGAKTISTTNNGSLSNPTSLTYTSNAAGDTTNPTITGSITPSAITSGGFTFAWPAGSDNVAVTGYEYSLNGGSSWTDAGNVLIKTVSGLTASTPYSVQVRDYDAAGNRADTPLSATITTSAAPGAGTITTQLANNTATLQINLTGLAVQVLLGSTGAAVVNKTGQTTNASAMLAVTDAAITPGTAYFLAYVDPATGKAGITNKITAV